MNIKYIWLFILLIAFTACNDIEDVLEDNNVNTSNEILPELTSGSADFSNYVALGNSLTAGFTDNALFIAAQENSMPNLLSQKFALVGGGSFSQPMMNDNIGGLLFGGNTMPNGSFGPRLYFNGAGPAVLPGMPTTETFAPSNGPYNNMGVPGAASFHLLFDGYGNPNFLEAGLANPYFVRMASAQNATVLGDALAQSPTFVSLWIGNNDVLGYATSGGSTGAITSQAMFEGSINAIVGALQQAGVKGVMANIPDVTSIPYFTTVPYNPVPLDAATAGALNQGYAAYNGGLQQALAVLGPLGLITEDEVARRTISFSAGEGNALVIIDENLTDLGAINPAFAALPQYRQATEEDLFVLTLSSLIPQGYGTQIPLEDKWSLTPEEQMEIKLATDSFNATLAAAASQAGFAFVDANTLMLQLADGSFSSGDYTPTASLVTGGLFSLDGVHPTARGYALLANEFMKAIDATYGSNFEASGNLLNVGQYPTNYSPLLQ
ncbi:MAG: G-D-S-L family lipolytic protein [Flavobacteriaceae bacterium]|nr:G-D-S-L family lipolytic protein [Flavobacteriaceae bacterium]